MQVSVETTSGLERKVKITLPAEKYSEAVNNRIKKAARTAKVDGFRPGKVPETVIRSRFGDSIRAEALEELVRVSFGQAIQQENLNIASAPQFDTEAANEGQPVAYTATFEVYPQIDNLVELNNVTIEKTVAEVTEADVDNVIENLRKQRMQWTEVDRASQSGDEVTVNFSGIMDGEPLENGSAENAEVVIGANTMIPGFEDGLIGLKAGEETTLNLQFPAEYHAKELSGKAVQFAIKVNKVSAGTLPPLDDKLAEEFGVKNGVEGLKTEVRRTLEQNLEQVLAGKLKTAVMDKLYELNAIEVPKALIMDETRQLMQQLLSQLRSGNFAGQMPDLNSEAIQERARRRVALGLLLAEVIKKYAMKLDNQKVEEELARIAASYENPQEIINWYKNNKEKLAEIEAAVMEEQVVEKLLESAKLQETTSSYDAVINAK